MIPISTDWPSRPKAGLTTNIASIASPSCVRVIRNRGTRCGVGLSPTVAFRLILGLRLGDCLSLYVARVVGPATLERDDVIHHVAGSAVRVASHAQELLTGR